MRTLLIGAVVCLMLSPAPLIPESQIAGSLRGRVMTRGGSDLTPVRRAKVTLQFDDGLVQPKVTQTDINGAYSFDRVPQAKHTFTIQKPGFLTIATTATPDATLIMVRAGAIEGVVTTRAGDPLLNVVVTALQRQDNNAAPKRVAESRTDDLGRYRLHSLAEGDYIVEAATDQNAVYSIILMPWEKRPGITRVYYPAEGALDRAKPVRVSLGQTATAIDLTLTPAEPIPDPTVPVYTRTDAAGTGRIVGRVADASSGKAIANAQVLLDVAEGVIYSGWRRSDARGQFEFDRLPAGRYTIRATARRFVAVEFGQKRLDEPGARIEIRDGETFNASMALPRASAIEGTVVDEFGDPVPGVLMQAARKRYAAGRKRLEPEPSRSVKTDDQGHYRIAGLSPADYYVSALSGVYAGANEIGGFVPTYYPGTPDATTAAPVSIALGNDAVATFALTPGRMFSVSGTMVNARGKPVDGGGSVLLVTAESQQPLELNLARGETSADGRFVLQNVPPGVYMLQGLGPPRTSAGGPAYDPFTDFGALPVTVREGDVNDLLLTVTAGTVLKGRVVLDGGGMPSLNPRDLQIATIPTEFDSAPVGRGGSWGINDDFTFSMPRMFGVCRILIWTRSSALVLKRITRDDVDITDTPIDFRLKNPVDVEVVLTTHVSQVSGSVSGDKFPVDDYAVVFFASDPTKWFDRSRYLRVAYPVKDGRFELRGLPPEDYFAVALPRVAEAEWPDPEFLDRLRPLATAFNLAEGESKTLALKLRQRP